MHGKNILCCCFFHESFYALTKTHVRFSTGLYMTTSNSLTCTAKVYSEAPELQEILPCLQTDFVPQFKNLYPWIASDPYTRPILHAFIKRKNFIPDEKIWKRVKRSIEHGMHQRIIWTAEMLDASEGLPFSIKKRASSMRLSRVLKKTEDQSKLPRPQNN